MAVVETDSFRLTFPESWVLRAANPRAVVEGPAGQRVELSSLAIKGASSADELAAIKDKLRQNVLKTFSAMAADASYEPRTSIQEFNSPGSEEFFQQLFQSKDGDRALGLFGLINGPCALVATFDAPLAHGESALDVAEWLDSIKWLSTGQQKLRPAWKFWSK